ncbi:MAG: hypothetical protein Q7T08_14470 [Devosia sp.]|nr:hypothetical protein [Devosia sp.]
MNKTALLAAVLSMTTAAALAATPATDAQKGQFYAECFKTSQNQPLCTCKAEAAMKLIDSDFMAVVIVAMHDGGKLDPKYNTAYIKYIAASTKACGMGM